MISANAKFSIEKFPGGEPHVTVKEVWGGYKLFEVCWEFENTSEITDLLLLCDAAKRSGAIMQKLVMPYVPFSRQDRVANEGESFSLAVFCKLINSLGFKHVEIFDPHSDVTVALLDNVEVVPQHKLLGRFIPPNEPIWLISPDAGALKKITKLAAENPQAILIECSKKRDTETGAITGTTVHLEPSVGKVSRECFIVDDICDGGATFIAIAKELKQMRVTKPIHLLVTHGFFTRGLSVFDGLIDHVYTRKGKVK